MSMDLHTHSLYSDGTFTPAELVRMAKAAGISIFALADHDTMDGVCEALEEADKQGILHLSAVELDCESPFELHMLGLDVSPYHAGLAEALETLKVNRAKRNMRILERLAAHGCDVGGYMEEKEGNITRLHIAQALQRAGHATDARDAFVRYLSPGCPAYCAEQRLTPREAIALIHDAGGLAVLAHPCHIRNNPHALIAELAECGLDGLEAYYANSPIGEVELFVSLARQFDLLVTCGSDFHGGNRAGVSLGCAWRSVSGLRKTAEILQNRAKKRAGYS